jgi:chemotaxis signal transduction protein
MAQYLQIKVADIHVLLPALQVHEVASLQGLATQTDAHVVWRDKVIAFHDLGQLLDRPSSTQRSYGVVFSMGSDADEPVMLQVDEVLGLRSPQAQDMHPLPELNSQTLAWLDGVWLEPPNGRNSFRLRHPIQPSATQVAPLA